MRRELLDLAFDLARRGEPFAIATVVARSPPVSAQVGGTALITRDGGFHGWLGGSCTRPTVIAEAALALADGRPRLVVLEPTPRPSDRPGVAVHRMTCHSGGSVEIHVQPVLPPPRLVVYGLSPVAVTLAKLGKALGWSIHAVDPEATPASFPGAERVWTEAGALRIEGSGAPVFALVATQGEWDEEALVSALALAPAYVGVVASRRRYAEVRAAVSGRVPADALARVRNPAGIDLGGRRPDEIAVAILAEIVQSSVTAQAERDAVAEGATPATAIDPVCGMTVPATGVHPRAEHGGREYHFCCGGCRGRFVADPERFLTAPREPGAGA